MRALVSRPRDDAERIAAPLRALGVDVVAEPLLVIVPVAGPNIDLRDVQALLMTSANGARALASAIEERDIPVFAVGEQTARAAQSLGFARVESAGGDVNTLAALVRQRLTPTDGPLVHAAGSVQAGDLAGALTAEGFQVRIARLYDARPTAALSRETQASLRAGAIDAAFFFSPRTARTFVEHVRKADLVGAMTSLTAYALSPAVARELAPILSGRVRVADQPTQDALLDVFKADLKEAALKQPENAQKGTPIPDSGPDRPVDSSAPDTPETLTPETDGPTTGAPKTEGSDSAAEESRETEGAHSTTGDDAQTGQVTAEDTPADATPAETPPADDDPHVDDKGLDDGDGVYAGSAGNGESVKPDTLVASAQEQADHHTMRSVVRWLVILIVLVAIGFGTMPWWRDSVPAPLQALLPELPASADSTAVTDLQSQVDALSQALETLRGSVATAIDTAEQARQAAESGSGAPGVDPAAVNALRDRLTALEDRLTQQAATGTGGNEATAAVTGMSSERLDSLAADAAALQNDLASLTDRLDTLEQDIAPLLDAQDNGQARAVGLLLSVGLLRERINAGEPYDEALAAVTAVGPGESVASDMDTLSAHAETGVPTIPELRRAFDDIVDLAARRTIVPEGDGWWTDTVSSLMDSVTVRRKDEVVAGGGLSALSSAEVLLAEDDVTGAVEALSNLEGDAAKVVADWMADAKARASVDAALASLNAAALARIGGGPTTE
ncbi:hypothetical protein F1188_03385 [Roseospira marina]|uniref:Tetrapyrrole biosynthesis uroporphyrinogen III synthase domain-containing protein n=1 Tax=Roseospira marina TaxID=140057 RepID=A0A5M6IGG1_9PROT|nr:uroporphyrinogen-III synthase [Roseospira marina]KAA5606967.1 hypothetical protein F1188_03385 [Roseospira marina]MBB4312855.1 uroporphyrinogen-III synthase [Roseospira marina]MBB5086372.1 uroporphyrinogen-III synthase [Roseospira marina]